MGKDTVPSVSLSPVQRSAISCAMDFVSHCDAFSLSHPQISHKTVSAIAWKMDEPRPVISRGELRAMVAAITFTLYCLDSDPAAVALVEDVFPELIPDLLKNREILEYLIPMLRAHVAKLSRSK